MTPSHPLYTPLRSSPRTLLLTLDAFGTLFHPRRPVAEQYAAVAHEYGLACTGITPNNLQSAFKDAFRAQARLRPNYGRADVLRGRYGGPRQWWEEVIRGSFARALSAGREEDRPVDLPAGMVGALLDRFAGAEGYALYEDVAPFFARVRELKSSPLSARRFDRVLLGVVSNSDDRVPAVLKALGLRVGDTRADQDRSSMELPGFEERSGAVGSAAPAGHPCGREPDLDLDLIITSYEAGEEKPSRTIFGVARRQAGLLARSSPRGSTPASTDETDGWVCVHVGDDYEKDYLAARDAGWESYLLPRGDGQSRPGARTIHSLMDLIEEFDIRS